LTEHPEPKTNPKIRILPDGRAVRYDSKAYRDYKQTRAPNEPERRAARATAPPPLTPNDAKSNKTKKVAKHVDAAQAGAFVGAGFGIVSLMLCGDVAPLSLDSTEEREIGAALSACLQTLPTPIGETVALMGPWSKLASTLGGAILKRMAMITAAKAATAAARANAPPTRGPQAAPSSVPNAPMPQNGQRPQSPPNSWDIVAPAPVQL
jgi:hypothetical protein